MKYIILFALISIKSLYAQTVTGRIVCSDDKQPASFATVLIEGKGFGTASDEKNEGPLTSKGLSGLFAERYLRTPFMIYQPGIKNNLPKKNNSLINSSNFFPILFKLANLKMNNYVKKLTKVKNQKYIFAEHTHRGPGYENLLNGQIYNCIITNDFKYIKKSKIGILDKNKTKEILVRKNNEEINIINQKSRNLLNILPLIKKINARQKEILKK